MADTTHNYYEVNAHKYFCATHNLVLPHLWEKLESHLNPRALILDLGCGSGRDLLYFSQQGFRVVGIDYSLNLLRLARELSQQPVVLGDLTRPPFKNHTFDAAWAIGSLLHLSRHIVPSVLSRIHEILKPNALLLTSVKEGRGETVDALGRYNVFYQSDEWEHLLRESGYEIIEIEESNESGGIGIRGAVCWLVSLARAVRQEQPCEALESVTISI